MLSSSSKLYHPLSADFLPHLYLHPYPIDARGMLGKVAGSHNNEAMLFVHPLRDGMLVRGLKRNVSKAFGLREVESGLEQLSGDPFYGETLGRQ